MEHRSTSANRAAWLTAAALVSGCAPLPPDPPPARPANESAFSIQMFKAKAYLERDNPEMALRALLEARRLEPNNVDVTVLLGRLYDRIGRKEQALMALEQAVAQRPGDPILAHDHGVALFKMGRLAEAEAVFRKVLKDPAFTTPEDAYYNLGLVRKQQGDAAEMATLMTSALRINPAFAPAHESLAEWHHDQGREEEARRHWLAVLDARPEEPRTLEKLADSFLQAGETGKAAPFLLRILSAAPGSEQARRARSHLSDLGVTPGRAGETEVR